MTFGNKSVTATDTGGSFHGGFGNLTIDGSHVKPGGTIKAGSVAGNVVINLPADAAVDVHAHVLAGQICVNGRNEGNGVSASVNQNFITPGTGAAAGTPAATGSATTGQSITVDVHEVFGQIMIGGAGCGRPGR